MAKQKVKVGQEVKNKCPVCGRKGTRLIDLCLEDTTLAKLHNYKRLEFECGSCFTEFWFRPRTGKITVKKVDKTYVA